MNYDGPSFYKKDSKEKTINNQSVQSKVNNKDNHRQIEKEIKNYMVTPPEHSKIETDNPLIKSKKRSQHFRSKQIPQSLQKLDGWERNEWEQNLFVRLKERLIKKEEDYLLFIQDSQPNKKQKKDSSDKKSTPLNEQELSNQAKIASAHEEFKKGLTETTSGLHRSLSKIISEDKKAQKNGKNNLESLFIDSKKQR